ncbi:MAG: exodeoxyribonuclease VII large subunit [Nitrospirota bacterium]|nr:exodeoxyribonuclease VII large subunit [Nitrospirota bacterium]
MSDGIRYPARGAGAGKTPGNGPLPLEPAREILSVTSLTRRVKSLLEGQIGVVWLTGEVSGLRTPPSGHVYLTLKDAQAQVRAVIWGSTARYLSRLPADGDLVLCRASLTVYEPRGEYQVVIEYLEPAGLGELYRRFEEIRARLAAEGLFDAARKRLLPRLPRRVAVVTSADSAALRDVLSVLGRRARPLPVLVVPSLVQGKDAPRQLIAALEAAIREPQVDVIILARGGGAPEDLAAFNDEELARAVAASPVPVVAGVGHESDITVCDFAADLRAATPSAAAELVSIGWWELPHELTRLIRRLGAATGVHLERRRHRLERARAGLADPRARMRHLLQRTDDLTLHLVRGLRLRMVRAERRHHDLALRLAAATPAAALRMGNLRVHAARGGLALAARHMLEAARARLSGTAARLEGLSPLAVLARGYAIVRKGDAVLTRAHDAAPGDEVAVRLHRGELTCRVTESRPDPRPESPLGE